MLYSVILNSESIEKNTISDFNSTTDSVKSKQVSGDTLTWRASLCVLPHVIVALRSFNFSSKKPRKKLYAIGGAAKVINSSSVLPSK